jgi:competence protein ComEC
MTRTTAAGRSWLAAGSGVLLGTALQLQRAALADGPQRLALVALALVLIVVLVWALRPDRAGGLQRSGRPGRRRWLHLAGIAIAAGLLAHAGADWRAAMRLDDRLQPGLEGVDLVATGVVAELPRRTATGTRFIFEPEHAVAADGRTVRLPRRISLGWYAAADDEAALAEPAEPVRAGQRWRLPVRLRLPHGSLNPHGFDLELWLFERGIGATGSVRGGARAEAPRLLASGVGHPVERWRQHIKDAIEARVPDPAAAGVVAALAIGDQAAIDRAGWDLYRHTGVAHLLSVSGVHVTMLAWLAAAAIGRAWRWHARLPLLLPAPLAARWGGLAVALGYAVLAGWGVPAQRTVGMIAVVLLLRTSGLRWPLPLVWLSAAVAVVLADPWAMLQPGFWLSFVAVGLLMASDPLQPAEPAPQGRRTRALALLAAGLRTQAIATIGLAPLTLVFFQQVSVVGFVANLVAIPLVTLVVTPMSLLGMGLPPLWPLAAALVQQLDAFLQLLAGWPAGS